MNTDETALDEDDIVQSFQLEESQLRGRAARLGRVLDDVLTPHNYPEPVAHIVAETMTLALLLSTMLKNEGIFTLQARGDGPVSMVVADVTSEGNVRGCATYDTERLSHADELIAALETPESSQNHLAQYLGKGQMVFTADQTLKGERYQGIVELKGASLVDCVQHYFTQSEQIGTGIRMAVGRRGGRWRAGAIMLQHMPEEGKNPEAGMGNAREDDWRRAMVLLGSCTEQELLSPDLDANTLLYRLFHEEGVRVYKPRKINKECRCDNARVENALLMLSPDDLDYLAQQGKIRVKCEFCSTDYVFDADTLVAKSRHPPQGA